MLIPKGLEDPKFPNYVYIYGLKQTPGGWYERLTTYLLEKKFERGRVDKTLFINRSNDELSIA